MTKIYEPKIIKPMEGDIKKYHKVLLEYRGFDSISDYKRQTGSKDKATQIYNYLYDELQKTIINTNKEEYKKHHQSLAQYKKQLKEQNKNTKEANKILRQEKERMEEMKNNFNHLNYLSKNYQLEQPTKQSRNQRINRYKISDSNVSVNDNKTNSQFDRKALGGVFKETTLYNITVENMKSKLENIIMNDFYKKDSVVNMKLLLILSRYLINLFFIYS